MGLALEGQKIAVDWVAFVGVRSEEGISSLRSLVEDLEVLYSPPGVQAVVDNFQVDPGEVGTVKEGLVCLEGVQAVRHMEDQGAARTKWEGLDGVHSCQETDLVGHCSGGGSAVQDNYLLIPAGEVQNLWVLTNRVKGTMACT